MEGSLSKWTNVVHGWQYRYFVLGDDVLRYYTSKEKMLKGQVRGCIRLRGAAIGIDGGNDPLFTITVDGKVFHLQGRDQNERDLWVRALERVIHDKCGYYKPQQEDPVSELNKKISYAEQQSQTLLEQIRKLELIDQNTEKADKKTKQLLGEVLQSTKRLQNTVDLSVVVLKQVERHLGLNPDVDTNGGSIKKDEDVREDLEEVMEPPLSYSSSEDEFFDADSHTDRFSAGAGTGARSNSRSSGTSKKSGSRRPSAAESALLAAEPNWHDDNEDFDQLYNNNAENELGNVQQQHGSVLMHLLSQVSVGMDLTKVTLPTFILERRSLLEMYADFFAHPDDFIKAVEISTPEERFISVVRYYLNSIYPARKSGVAKKPYNPILGEIFRCRWSVPNVPELGQKTESGPFPGSDRNQVTFIAEQVSHHPPISAFYAEHPARKISFNAHIWTKSSFLGLSIGVTNIGCGVVTLHDYDEKYVVTFPNGYGRSIMSTPWIELGGKVEVKCEKTGYSAEIEFHSKPFFGGKPHKISGNILKAGHKKPVMTLRGEWNTIIYAKRPNEDEFLFSDVRVKPDVRKECVPVMRQNERESRRLWRHVTAALFHNRINVASSAKRWIEQRQRDETKVRKERGEIWVSQNFEEDGQGGWTYRYALGKRSSPEPSTSSSVTTPTSSFDKN